MSYQPINPDTIAAYAAYREAIAQRSTTGQDHALEQRTGTAYGVALVRELREQGIMSHTRADRQGNPVVHIYRREPSSPTGVLHVGSVPATREFTEGVRAIYGGYTPLSPTEPR